MTTLIKSIDKPGIRNLIIFVHGFTGNEKTFKNTSGKFFYEMFSSDVREVCNIYNFVYYSRLIDLPLIKYLCRKIPVVSRFISENNNRSIEDYAKLLATHYDNCINKYDKIGFISHSMGGILVKDLVCSLFARDQKVPAFNITLATPHKGVEEAKLGKLIGNHQATSLRPFSDTIITLNASWKCCSHIIGSSLFHVGSAKSSLPAMR